MVKRLSLLMLSAFAVWIAGCGNSATRTVYPVEGEVFVSAKPAEGARIVFQPADDRSAEAWPTGFPRAVVNADGTFKLSTFALEDGAPAGEYIVMVTWPEPSSEDGGAEEDSASKDRLGGRYSNSDAPQLHAKVENQATKLARFELKP